jgi:hypothetical protein
MSTPPPGLALCRCLFGQWIAAGCAPRDGVSAGVREWINDVSFVDIDAEGEEGSIYGLCAPVHKFLYRFGSIFLVVFYHVALTDLNEKCLPMIPQLTPTMPPGPGKDTTGLVGARPPPPPPPPSPDNRKPSLITNQILTNLPRQHGRLPEQLGVESTTTAADDVDDSIARRRAELRRLQQRSGGSHVAPSLAIGGGGLASARSRLGGLGADGGTVVRPRVEEGIIRAATVAAASIVADDDDCRRRSETNPPIVVDVVAAAAPPAPVEATPTVAAAFPHAPTPSTAAITRRLDYDSYGGIAGTTGGGGFPSSHHPPLPVAARPAPPAVVPRSAFPRHRDALGMHSAQGGSSSSDGRSVGDDAHHHDRRVSEIFPVGRRGIRENGSRGNDRAAAVGPPPFNPFSPTGPVPATVASSFSSSSSFAAAATVPVVRSSGVVRVPPMASSHPPIMMKGTSTTKNSSTMKNTTTTKARGDESDGNQTSLDVRSVVDDGLPQPPILVEEEEGGTTTNVMTSQSHDDTNDNKDETISGRVTPVMSNVHEDVQRLMNVLERTEREKKEALEQVERLRTLLDSGAAAPVVGRQHHFGKQQEDAHRRPSRRSAVGVRRDENPLISSVVPPLTPRARPGSRAASPERGGGGDPPHHHHLDGGVAVSFDGGVREGRPGGKRTTAPLPRQHSSVEEVAVEDEYMLKAARCIPNEYGTRLASYLVRRPFVVVDNDDDNDGGSWSRHAHLTPREEYLRVATASDPNTLEVLAHVKADGSVFILTGRSDVRHGRSSAVVAAASTSGGSFDEDSSLEWVVFDDVEGMDRALGKVTYIDVEGNERDYWLGRLMLYICIHYAFFRLDVDFSLNYDSCQHPSLEDSIYEEALTTRESYCMSMISAAIALKEVLRNEAFEMPNAHYVSIQQHNEQPSILSAGAQGNDMPKFAEPANQILQATSIPPAAVGIPPNQKSTQKSEWHEPIALPVESSPSPLSSAAKLNDQQRFSESKSSVPPTEDLQFKPNLDEIQPPTKLQEEEYEPADSALTFMVIYLFSLFFSIALCVFKIPIRIGTLLFKVVVLTVTLRMLWLFLADDNGACEIGACVDHRYNMPGIC